MAAGSLSNPPFGGFKFVKFLSNAIIRITSKVSDFGSSVMINVKI